MMMSGLDVKMSILTSQMFMADGTMKNENYFTDRDRINFNYTAMVESTDQEIDSEWLGTFTDSGRLEISYRELSLSVQWSGHIATFTWTLKR